MYLILIFITLVLFYINILKLILLQSLQLFKPFLIKKLLTLKFANNISEAINYISIKNPFIQNLLKQCVLNLRINLNYL
jgi:hypothetical protein